MSSCEVVSRPRPVSTLNRKVYLGLYDNRTWPEPDSRDEQRVRDFMVQKYENKRFYVAPTEAMRDEARRMNEAALSKTPQTKPLRALLGENATRLVVGNSQNHSSVAHSMSGPVKSSAPPPVTAQSQQPPVKPAVKPGGGAFDLLGDIGADPFASSAPTTANASSGGFADFSAFGSSQAGTPPFQSPLSAPQATQPSAAVAFPPMPSAAPLQPFGAGGGGASLQPTPLGATPPTSTPTSQPPAAPANSSNFASISDKYAALADLDTTFNAPATTQPTAVNWGGPEMSQAGGGGGGGGVHPPPSSHPPAPTNVNWGGSGSGDSGSNLGWGGQSSAAGGGGAGGSVGWNGGGGGGVPATSGGSLFGGAGAPSTAANPFGTSSAGGQANPFGATSAAAGFPPTSNSAFGQTANAGGFPPASSAAGFGYQQQQQPQQQQQQFPVQNGGFGMVATTAGGGFGAGYPGGVPPHTAPPSYGVAQQQGFQAQPGMAQQQQGFPQAFPQQQQQGFAQQQQGFASWGQMGGGGGGGLPQQQPAAAANPFMVGTQHSALAAFGQPGSGGGSGSASPAFAVHQGPSAGFGQASSSSFGQPNHAAFGQPAFGQPSNAFGQP